jgi:CHAT domain-containing protein/Tfp pilus assembly protein PilF
MFGMSVSHSSRKKGIFSLVACLILCVTAPSRGQATDEAALRALTSKFFAAYQSKSLREIISMWSESSPDLDAARQEFQKSFAADGKTELKNLTFRKIAIEGMKAVVRVSVEMNSRKVERTLRFIKEGEEWRVRSYWPSEQDIALALISAKSDDERKALLEEEKDWVNSELHKALALRGQPLLMQGNFSQSLTIFNIALIVAERLNDKIAIAKTLGAIANIYFSQGDYAHALDHYERSLGLAREANNKDVMLLTLINIGTVHRDQGDYAKALDIYLNALKLGEELGNKYGISGTLSNLGVLYEAQGNYAQAIESYNKSLKLSEELGLKPLTSRTLQSLGNVYALQSNYVQALAAYGKGFVIQGEIEDKEGQALTLNSIGQLHESQGNLIQAAEFYQKSLKINQEMGSKLGIADALNNIGNLYSAQGDYRQALDSFQKSRSLNEELGNRPGIAQVLNSIGDAYSAQGDYKQAMGIYQDGLRLAEALGNKTQIASTIVGIGRLHLLKGSYHDAIDSAKRATGMASEIGNPGLFWQASIVAGKAHKALGQLDNARQSFIDAITTIEKMRAQVAGNEKDQRHFFSGKVEPYYAMVDLLIEQNKTDEALAYAERAKSRVLLDVLRSGRLKVTKTMSHEEDENERRLSERLVSLNAQIYRERLRPTPDQTRLGELDARLQKVRLEYEAFQTTLYGAHPELKAQRGEMRPLSLNDAVQLMPDARMAILEFVVMDDKTHLLVLTRERNLTHTLLSYRLNVKRSQLDSLVTDFHKRLGERNLDFRNLARKLYDLLLKPAEKQLQGKTTLCIVPDSILWELPFQALQPSEDRYLIEHHAIFYAPSLTVLKEMEGLFKKRSRATQPLQALLAFGNPALSTETVAQVTSIYRGEKLGPLPEAEIEVRTLSHLYGPARCKVYIGAEAKEGTIKAEMGNYHALHFATHGILDNNNPMYSQLLLSLSGGTDIDDGLLEAWEIARLDLKADMTVLSACDTARGRVEAGEGLIGMSWAFFVAGCPTTVVSQWKVSSASTTQLMKEFHKNLLSQNARQKGASSKADALRLAALRLLKDQQYSHPYYWAPFVVIGNAR